MNRQTYMNNGELINEIRSIIESGKKISPNIRDRLILASIVDLHTKIDGVITHSVEQDKKIRAMTFGYRILVILGGILTTVATTLAIMFITGKAEIVFK